MNEQLVMKAYLFLSALEQSGEVLETIDIHMAWIGYCHGDQQPGYDLIVAAQTRGLVS